MRKHAVITLRTSDGDTHPEFDADLKLDSYDLPGNSRVYVEAYRKYAHQRFDFGTIGLLSPPANRRLTEFGGGEGVLFRVKVVESQGVVDTDSKDEKSAPPRILAHVDRLQPRYVGQRRSLLALDPWDSRDEVWHLDIDYDTGPLLKISYHLAPERHTLVRSGAFVSLVLPEVLRRILMYILTDDQSGTEEEGGTWRAKWLRLACQMKGEPAPPDQAYKDAEFREGWIDDVVTAFCKKHNVAKHFKQHMDSGIRT